MPSAIPTLRYSVSGDGPSLVLLDWTPWETTALSEALAARFRVIDVGPPEEGGTVSSIDEVAGAVVAVADKAGASSFALVGTSLGANVALRVALQRPGGISPLVLVSPTCVEPKARIAFDTPEAASAAMLAHPGHRSVPGAPPGRTARLAALSERWAREGRNHGDLLPELSCATLAVFGQEDRLVSREAGGVWKERVPNCSVSFVYDAGHAVGVDRPAALLNVVLDFLERRETFIVENRSFLINP